MKRNKFKHLHTTKAMNGWPNLAKNATTNSISSQQQIAKLTIDTFKVEKKITMSRKQDDANKFSTIKLLSKKGGYFAWKNHSKLEILNEKNLHELLSQQEMHGFLV